MIIIGLTGASGAGKGEVGRALTPLGVSVIDADAVYHRLLREKKALRDAITARFPDAVAADGTIDRRALARIVFADPGEKRALEAIAHPYVVADIERHLLTLSRSSCEAILLDAPALFESGADTLCDTVIGVVAPMEMRTARIEARDGLSSEDAALRLRAQPPDEFYRARCTHILDNNGSIGALHKKARALYQEISRRGK